MIATLSPERQLELCRHLLDGLPQIVWACDHGGVVRYLNRSGQEYTGCHVEQSAGWSWLELVHPDDQARATTAWASGISTNGTFEISGRLRHADGDYRQFHLRFTLVVESAEPAGWWTVVCTEVTNAEQEQRWCQALLDTLHQGVWATNAKGEIVAGFGRSTIFGPDPESPAAVVWSDRIHPDDRRKLESAWAESAATGRPFEVECRMRRDHEGWLTVAIRGVPLRDSAGQIEEWIGVANDVTELRQAEERLGRSERRYRSLVAALYQMVAVTDTQGRAIEVADHSAIFGTKEQPTADAWFARIHPDDRGRAAGVWAAGMATGQVTEAEYRIQRHDGEWRQITSRMVPVHDDAGRVAEWVSVVNDVTDLRRAEAELRRSERRYRTLVTATAQIVWVMNTATEPTVVHGAEDFFGSGDDAQTAAAWGERIHPEDLAHVGDVIDTAFKTGQPFRMDYRLRRQDGKWRQVATRGVPVRDESGRVEEWVGVTGDVTDAKLMEEQLRQAQKMEAVGRLAGGIAHDFNNLLTVITGFSELAMSNLPAGSADRALLGEIRGAGERAARLTSQLLSFSRQQVLEPKVLDLNEVVTRAETMLRRLIGADVRLSTVLDPNLPRVQVDPGQIEQVILNLAVNSRDAMPSGGRLTIETAGVVVDGEGLSGEPDVRPGYYARLAVSDTGQGMTDEVKGQLFEPFFTTKEAGKGTGLGLAVVHGVVKQSGGYIGVYSEVGLGTTFRLLFPAVDAAPGRSSVHDLVLPARGTETILLVEDEEAVRRLALVSLEILGYTVLVAGNGREAMRVVEQYAGPIHLLLTDVVMPEMGGRVLAETLRTTTPGLRVLYMSGYTDDAVLRQGIVGEMGSFLQKPFTPLSLAKKVRAVLDQVG